MAHGSRPVGGVEVVALCDGVVLASETFGESYPGVTPSILARARREHPETFSGDRWRLHVHAFVLRSAGTTVLVDTGVGPETAPAFSWTGVRGALDRELEAAGVGRGDVDLVAITHLHDDHLGWNVVEGTTDPMFPNARYLLRRADWDLYLSEGDEEDLAILESTLRPLERAGVLDLLDEADVALTSELTLVLAPGHTPGHQVLLIDSEDERAVISADTVNHPVQLFQPGLAGSSDFEPERAARTRAAWLERVRAEDRLVCPSHFPEPFGRFVLDGDHHRWVATASPDR